MKILLIDNHTSYLHNVTKALAGHEVQIQEYQPGLVFNDTDKDLVVLSGGGGEGFELIDKFRGKLWYEDEMNFIMATKKPVVGVCMGFEVICAAYGSKVRQLHKKIKGFHPVQSTDKGFEQLPKHKLKQFEWHNFAIPAVSAKHFEVLADSEHGIEMIKHRNRPIVATQFHPEVEGGTLNLSAVMAHLKHT